MISKRRLPEIAAIRASVLRGLVEELDRRTGKTDMLLAGHGLLRSQLEDPYARVPMTRYVALFEEAAVHVGDPLFGARLGAAFRPADLGPIGMLFSLSSTIRAALARMARHMAVVQGATGIGLVAEADRLIWSYHLEDPGLWPRRQESEYSVVATCQLMRTCFSVGWTPVEVHFEHTPPSEPGALQRLLRCPLLFDQPANRIVIANEDADRVHRREDRDLIAILERHVADISAREQLAPGIVEQVGALIGIYLGHKPVTLVEIAREMRMPPRSLQRRLAEEGTSLRHLLRAHRQEIAGRQLSEAATSKARIAEALGYADATVFWRARKSWSGDLH
ncbi:AraC family transcriptional regulator ligand-binding domain-containing protein [Ancylobacter sonchi]|uniref:AraC family transcriptional regulator n=1 Tax=Ancylobacter sonchi TaxID=1937790 RepID=UPI001BD1DDE6|nr:AraC family transcriptional regulator [Ancylobacter sonchi]MBS7533891.1 AraC family transcriptional regulator ligand-binding domain-containing protein [Ancylobacter sonchi]